MAKPTGNSSPPLQGTRQPSKDCLSRRNYSTPEKRTEKHRLSPAAAVSPGRRVAPAPGAVALAELWEPRRAACSPHVAPGLAQQPGSELRSPRLAGTRSSLAAPHTDSDKAMEPLISSAPAWGSPELPCPWGTSVVGVPHVACIKFPAPACNAVLWGLLNSTTLPVPSQGAHGGP